MNVLGLDRKFAEDYMTVKVRTHRSLPALRYLVFCNVLHICNVRAIPTHRVYQIYDIHFISRISEW